MISDHKNRSIRYGDFFHLSGMIRIPADPHFALFHPFNYAGRESRRAHKSCTVDPHLSIFDRDPVTRKTDDPTNKVRATLSGILKDDNLASMRKRTLENIRPLRDEHRVARQERRRHDPARNPIGPQYKSSNQYSEQNRAANR
jgi:hypothetical protein